MTSQRKSRPGKDGSDLLGGIDRINLYSIIGAVTSHIWAGNRRVAIDPFLPERKAPSHMSIWGVRK